MAPNQDRVEHQTFEVLRCLFEDDHVAFRHHASDLETDSPGDDDDSFDPVLIADKLRSVADALNENVEVKAALRELKKTAAQEVLDKALVSGVDALVKSQVGQRAEVAPELQTIKAAVVFGLYIKKEYPALKSQLQMAIGSFLNQRVGPWLTQQGGWEQVASVAQP